MSKLCEYPKNTGKSNKIKRIIFNLFYSVAGMLFYFAWGRVFVQNIREIYKEILTPNTHITISL